MKMSYTPSSIKYHIILQSKYEDILHIDLTMDT